MDCKNCVSALVCKDAQDPSYRVKVTTKVEKQIAKINEKLKF